MYNKVNTVGPLGVWEPIGAPLWGDGDPALALCPGPYYEHEVVFGCFSQQQFNDEFFYFLS